MRYRIITYGCQMNERDSDALAAMLEDLGYRPAAAGEPEDLVVFNTCCVRENAERKIMGRVLEYRLEKERRPELLVGVGGCFPQQPGAAERIAGQAPWLDFIFGTHNSSRVPVLVATARMRAGLRAETGSGPYGPVIEIDDSPDDAAVDQPRLAARRVEALVNVSFGCDNYCSYCIVPYVRGRERSRPVQAVVDEVVGLARQGVREVTLLGQNVNSYGRDLAGGADFPGLLAAVDMAASPFGLVRIRFVTSHPRDLSHRLIEAMATLPAVCEHIHLPVQAGSDRVLKAMNRGYTRGHYLALVERLRRAVPGVGLTTDIIVGFPGETEEDFEQTLELVRLACFDSAFTFAYSRRRGTPAAEMAEQVPLPVRRERLARLNRLQEEVSRESLARLVDTGQEVLFLGPSEKDPNVMAGRTRAFHYVLTPAPAELRGRLAMVRIRAARTWTLSGELVPATGEGASR
ncbi:MAG: tRNA (N6-isopentenyl adenosine(37)-C2)-methylthiotransferase MiaB [Bacillota bacterium]|nr:tRNA (N6-isopentenyl adenosine(37)-C2)-methylthiotransferase MiaB [Bacillota bacterium]